MAEIHYTHAAFNDLQNLSGYILDNWGEHVAKRALKKITSDIRTLEQFPALGADLGRMIDVPTDYRYIISEKNYVFYRIEADTIHIIRVLNEQQDYMQHLFGMSREPGGIL